MEDRHNGAEEAVVEVERRRRRSQEPPSTHLVAELFT